MSPFIPCSLPYAIASSDMLFFRLPHNSTGWHLDSNTSARFNDTGRGSGAGLDTYKPPAYFEDLNKSENGLISNIDSTNLEHLISFEKDARGAYSSQAASRVT